MADILNTQQFPNVVLTITNAAGQPATVDGVPVWASSDATVVTVVASADGMGAVVSAVAPGTARITVSADADMGAGTITITGVSEDINVTLDPAQRASIMSLNLGTAAPKTPANPTP
jgi:hypothetical protein